MTDPFRPAWGFEAKRGNDTTSGFAAPRVAGDDNHPAKATPTSVPVIALAIFISVWLLALCEGTLAWVVLEYAEDFGWVARIPWWPCVVIALCVNLIVALHKAAFRTFDRQ